MAAHDLKAPLRTMHGFAEALKEDYAPVLDDAAREYISYIAKGATDMRAIIDGMLDFARLGEDGVVFENVDLGEVIAGVQAELRGALQTAGADVQVVANLPSLVTDAKILAALVHRVLMNAITFRAEKQSPHIIIDIAESDATVVITITDDGIGLPQDQWDRVFQPFVRLKTGPAYTGAGLGLTTVKKAAALLGGSVVLESKLDQGAVVTVTLPRNSL